MAQKDLEKFSGSGAKKIKIFFCSKSLLKAPQRVWHPQKPQIRVRDPPGRPVWARFVGKMAQIGVKKRVFFKKIFFDPYHSRKVPGGSGTLKNAKLTLHGPKMGPFEAILCVKRAFLAPKNPILGSKKREIFGNFFCSQSLPEGPRRVWDPQKPKIKPPWPQIGPVWAHFVGKMGHFRVKKRDFFRNFFFIRNHSWMVPGGSGTLKSPKLSLHGPQLGPFGAILWVKWAILGSKTLFFQKNFIPNRSCMVPGGSSSLKPPKLRLHCP